MPVNCIELIISLSYGRVRLYGFLDFDDCLAGCIHIRILAIPHCCQNGRTQSRALFIAEDAHFNVQDVGNQFLPRL